MIAAMSLGGGGCDITGINNHYCCLCVLYVKTEFVREKESPRSVSCRHQIYIATASALNISVATASAFTTDCGGFLHIEEFSLLPNHMQLGRFSYILRYFFSQVFIVVCSPELNLNVSRMPKTLPHCCDAATSCQSNAVAVVD